MRGVAPAFRSFFAAKGHQVCASASLIPHGDPTLLFTNAGMVPFKSKFLNAAQLDQEAAQSLVSVQRCVRAGGKHNDLEQVGHSPNHMTMFQMLGNFSFGAYWKLEAIDYAWEFLTNELSIPAERLVVTVLRGDEETERIWRRHVGLSGAQVRHCGEDENFWSMGSEDSPCGPCTEIHYVLEDGSLLEVWNLVFMQFIGASRSPLPVKCIDTGMGLERIERVLDGVSSNYDTKSFAALMRHVEELAPGGDQVAHRVLADHARAATFLIADGVFPSPNGRGYVLRRIVRRALRFAAKAGLAQTPILSLLSPTVIESFGESFPGLAERQDQITSSLREEEMSFLELLPQGLSELASEIAKLDSGQPLSGEALFKLHDRFGMPSDLTAMVCQEQGISVDVHAADALKELHRMKSSGTLVGSATSAPPAHNIFPCQTHHRSTGESKSRVVSVLDNNWLVVEPSPFYPTGGGQQGDVGIINNSINVLETSACGAIKVDDTNVLKAGDVVETQVDVKHRAKCSANHTATHLLHSVLTDVLGDSVRQAGSFVGPDRLRFDFSYNSSVDRKLLDQIEQNVQQLVLQDIAIDTEEVDSTEALKDASVKSLFGEKYGDVVRVVSIGSQSKELCGGTHVSSTREINPFVISKCSGISKGIKRIEALTGSAAVDYLTTFRTQIREVADQLKVNPDEISGRISKLQKLARSKKKAKGESTSLRTLRSSATMCVYASESADVKELRKAAQQLKKEDAKLLHVIISQGDSATNVVCSSGSAEHNAADALQRAMEAISDGIGGRGGGNKELASGILPTYEDSLETLANKI